MLYINSFSPIEQELFQNVIVSKINGTQLNANHILDKDYLNRQYFIQPHDTICYSFLDFSKYSYLDSFTHEIKNMNLLIDFAKENQFKNFILLSYPGVYVNSDNLFLQHKAMLEEIVANSGINFTILSVQNILSSYKKINSLETLFYHKDEEKYILPKKFSQIVYSISSENLAEIILKISPTAYNNSYDVMDSVFELKELINIFNPHISVERISPLYLNFRSIIGNYISPTMLDLFLRPTVPMYKSRAGKEFEIDLIQIEFVKNEVLEKTKNPIELTSIGFNERELNLAY